MFCLSQENPRTHTYRINEVCQRIQGGLILMNRPKFQHNFSKVYTKNDRYLLVGCVDCEKTITFFLKRFD